MKRLWASDDSRLAEARGAQSLEETDPAEIRQPQNLSSRADARNTRSFNGNLYLENWYWNRRIIVDTMMTEWLIDEGGQRRYQLQPQQPIGLLLILQEKLIKYRVHLMRQLRWIGNIIDSRARD